MKTFLWNDPSTWEDRAQLLCANCGWNLAMVWNVFAEKGRGHTEQVCARCRATTRFSWAAIRKAVRDAKPNEATVEGLLVQPPLEPEPCQSSTI